MSPARLVAIGFGLGLLRPAPGTWASAAAVLAAYGIALAGGPWLLALAALAAALIGFWAAKTILRGSADRDPSEVVIDEIAGQWIALLPVVFGAAGHPEVTLLDLWPGWLAGFVLFRLFDIWKPGPIGRYDRRGDWIGLMGDDLLAGVAAGIGTMLLAGLYHGVLGL